MYAIRRLDAAIAQLAPPEGYEIQRYAAREPFSTEQLAVKWDGE